MASVFNKGLYISVFGESYSNAIGVVLDNFPAGIKLNVETIKKDMQFRAPLKGYAGASKRKETDEFEILSGIFNGHSTGSPICAVIYNKSLNSSHYNEIKNLIRPSHADYTAKVRYNNFNDFRGGGHLSGRLTAPLVFAGSICKQALKTKKIETFSHIFSVGKIKDYEFNSLNFNAKELRNIKNKPIAVLNDEIIKEMLNEIEKAKKIINEDGSSLDQEELTKMLKLDINLDDDLKLILERLEEVLLNVNKLSFAVLDKKRKKEQVSVYKVDEKVLKKKDRN